MARMKVAQISKPGGSWELVEREIPEPGSGEVRIKVEACGVCHSDTFVKRGRDKESLAIKLGAKYLSTPPRAFRPKNYKN